MAVLTTVAVAAETGLALVGGAATAAEGAALITAVAVLAARYVSGFESQDGGDRIPLRMIDERRAGLSDWEWVVGEALAGRGDRARLLHPRLQRLYAARLTERHAVSLYDQPEAAAALVGPEVWRLIDPSRTPPAPIPLPALRAAVDRLNEL
ncbi:hypothetical protein [Kitasatospora sp. MAP5-34]|uniref:hypothetical protein n=1 Tax=Kitasatospora sp. MAP5-34 TaxID=3035102 RepID=UPI002475AFF0|nr:hypothetical protein [Kitasatospora sp. MAP5-34]